MKQKNSYITLSKSVIERTDLSFAAKGVYAYIATLPNDWSFSRENIQRTQEDSAAMIKGLKELEEKGYIQLEPDSTVILL